MLSVWVDPQNSASGPQSESGIFLATPLAIPSGRPEFLGFSVRPSAPHGSARWGSQQPAITRKLWERLEFPLEHACASHLKQSLSNPLKVSCDFP